MSDAPFIRLEMQSNPLYLSGARDLIAAVAKRLGFSDVACCQIALAVDEALCNIIRHGYKRQGDGRIWVSLERRTDPDGLRIVIEDEARQVDPEKIRGRDLDEIRPGGLGVHIIREVMDEVVFEKRERIGMRLTLVKHLAAADCAALAGGSEDGANG